LLSTLLIADCSPSWKVIVLEMVKTGEVPHPEWVLMYRLGLTGTRIAELTGTPRSKVGYHLTVARRLDPGLDQEHKARTPRKGVRVSAGSVERMNEPIEFVGSVGRYPSYVGSSQEERRLAVWLQRRRHEVSVDQLAPVFRDGLRALPGWEFRTRSSIDESRWHECLAALVAYRASGKDWPRHKKTASEDEHTLGIWLHTQRYKLRRGELPPSKTEILDSDLPGWREGRRRGRKPRE
jgi:hypothetical protein